MEGERRSVFDRLGPVTEPNSDTSNFPIGNENKRRQLESECGEETKKIKLTDSSQTTQVTESSLVVTSRRVDGESSEEGEIFDDDPIEDLKEETNKDKTSDEIKESMSPISVDGNMSGEDNSAQAAVTADENIESGQIVEENENNMNDKDDTGSHYSDWSDGEDELLQGDNETNVPSQENHDVIIENDNNTMDTGENFKEKLTDLEIISDDDLDNDDLFGDKDNDMEQLLSGDNSNQDGTNLDESKILEMLEIDLKDLIDSSLSVAKEDNDTDSQNKAHREAYRKRNSALSLLNRMGFSSQYAGEDLSKQIIERLQAELGDDYRPMLHQTPAIHHYYRMGKERREQYFANCKINGLQDKRFLESLIEGNCFE